MPERRTPGVVAESPVRLRPIEGVSTSVAAFVGPTSTGPSDRVSKLITSLAEFERAYGAGAPLTFTGSAPMPHFMWQAARAFFANGGQRLYVAPVHRADGRRPEPADLVPALERLTPISEISIVAAPGSTYGLADPRDPGGVTRALEVAHALVVHVQTTRSRIAIVDSGDDQLPTEVMDVRNGVDSSFGALYYPWVRVTDPASGADLLVPPSGFVAGVYARVDLRQGVHKAPANEQLSLAIGLERELGQSEADALSSSGVNLLRTFSSRGVVVWGARTLTSDSDWKYVNVRRFIIFLEQSIDRGLQWVAFEPNGETLWSNVRRTIEDFLFIQWRTGALTGTKPEEAYFVRCDRTTMTQNDLDNGRLTCLIGVAPIRPAEFVIFRIGQWTADHKP
jgi:Bacteriophage tail sheath protein